MGHRLWKNLKKNELLIFLTWATALLSLVKGSAPECKIIITNVFDDTSSEDSHALPIEPPIDYTPSETCRTTTSSSCAKQPLSSPSTPANTAL